MGKAMVSPSHNDLQMLIMLGLPHLKKTNRHIWGHSPSFDAHLLQSLLASGKRCCSSIPRCLIHFWPFGPRFQRKKTHDILYHYILMYCTLWICLDHHPISRDEMRK